jgi:hypothetical protein
MFSSTPIFCFFFVLIDCLGRPIICSTPRCTAKSTTSSVLRYLSISANHIRNFFLLALGVSESIIMGIPMPIGTRTMSHSVSLSLFLVSFVSTERCCARCAAGTGLFKVMSRVKTTSYQSRKCVLFVIHILSKRSFQFGYSFHFVSFAWLGCCSSRSNRTSSSLAFCDANQ